MDDRPELPKRLFNVHVIKDEDPIVLCRECNKFAVRTVEYFWEGTNVGAGKRHYCYHHFYEWEKLQKGEA